MRFCDDCGKACEPYKTSDVCDHCFNELEDESKLAKDPKHINCAKCSANMTIGQIIEYCGCCDQPDKTCGGFAIRKSILIADYYKLDEAEVSTQESE